MKHPTYSVLMEAMKVKGIKVLDVANLLHIDLKSVYNKMHGRSDFSIVEALKIHREFFPDESFSVLFEFDQNEK